MTNFRTLTAPDLTAFEDMAEESFARFPDKFRELCEGLVILIEDFPAEDVLEEMECETPFDILGLFQGTGLAQAGAVPETGQIPNAVWLYRRPILDYWAEHEETLGHVITHVLVHEIGHHFGLSDAEMEAIEAEADGTVH